MLLTESILFNRAKTCTSASRLLWSTLPPRPSTPTSPRWSSGESFLWKTSSPVKGDSCKSASMELKSSLLTERYIDHLQGGGQGVILLDTFEIFLQFFDKHNMNLTFKSQNFKKNRNQIEFQIKTHLVDLDLLLLLKAFIKPLFYLFSFLYQWITINFFKNTRWILLKRFIIGSPLFTLIKMPKNCVELYMISGKCVNFFGHAISPFS